MASASMSSFRVLQFNMQFGQRWDDANPDSAVIDLDGTIAEIRRHDADIIFLQEVEHALPDGVQVQPPPNYERLKSAFPDYDSYFAYPGADPRELPFGIGLAIFSRTALHARTQEELPSPSIEFTFNGKITTPTNRLLIGARTVWRGCEIQLFNTHLLAQFMLGEGKEDYREQRDRVVHHLKNASGPTILGGDFNVSVHRVLIDQFAAHGFSAVQDSEITWRRRPYVLDHIFYNPPLRKVHHAVAPTMASDHHVVIADFEFGS
jgi:endonuclease/exonuclease/phosphatase family metal-dependent hydrolase